MAEAPSSIFNKRATEKLRSPDDLDKYVRVTNPSIWVVLIACIALLVGLLAWGVFGTVASSVNTKGVHIQDRVFCYLSADDAAEIQLGDEALVDGEKMKVSEISPTPSSREEVQRALNNDFLAATLMESDWAYTIRFEGDASAISQNVPVPIVITVERIAPLSLIIDGRP